MELKNILDQNHSEGSQGAASYKYNEYLKNKIFDKIKIESNLDNFNYILEVD